MKTNLVETALSAFLSRMLIYYDSVRDSKYILCIVIRIICASIYKERTTQAHNHKNAQNFLTLLNCYPSCGTILAMCYLIEVNKTHTLGAYLILL